MDPNKRARVTVEHYQQNADLGGYTLYETDQLGAFDLGATLTPEKKEYRGYRKLLRARLPAGESASFCDVSVPVRGGLEGHSWV